MKNQKQNHRQIQLTFSTFKEKRLVFLDSNPKPNQAPESKERTPEQIKAFMNEAFKGEKQTNRILVRQCGYQLDGYDFKDGVETNISINKFLRAYTTLLNIKKTLVLNANMMGSGELHNVARINDSQDGFEVNYLNPNSTYYEEVGKTEISNSYGDGHGLAYMNIVGADELHTSLYSHDSLLKISERDRG